MPQFTIESHKESARIKVVGVGGAGGNAVNRMIEANLEGVEFISLNTDMQALEASHAGVKLSIGSRITKGLGAGMNPDLGRQAVMESRDEVEERLKGADMIFITAGMGGGTGTGAAPVVAEIARELGILTVGVVTRPFDFEGPQRRKNAASGLDELRKVVDTIITIPNQKLLSVADRKTTLVEAFRMADDVLFNATRGITEMILKTGLVNVDFADVRTIMSNGGDALMGSGTASGDGRALKAAEMALGCPLLDSIDIAGATGMLVNITGRDIGLMELDEVMGYFREALGEGSDDRTIWGLVEDPNCSEEFRVTLIATGFPGGGYESPAHQAGRQHAINAAATSPYARPQAPAPVPVVSSRAAAAAGQLPGRDTGRQNTAVAEPSGSRPVALSPTGRVLAQPNPTASFRTQNMNVQPVSRQSTLRGRNGGYIADELVDENDAEYPAYLRGDK